MSKETRSRFPKIHFFTFGAGDVGAEKAAKRLGKQATESGFFDVVEVLSAAHLPSQVTDLFSPIRFEDCRGFGYWAWKPYLVNQKVETLLDGDVLVYLDAGFEINTMGAERFTYYLDYVARNHFLVFPIPHQHRHWVKPHKNLQVGVGDFFRNQVAAGFIMLRVSEVSRRIVNKWYEISFEDSGAALTESYSENACQYLDIKGHRHDQSVLSHVIISENIKVLDRDETHHTPWARGEDFPFLALRNKTGNSRLKKIFRWSRRRKLFIRIVEKLSFGYLFRVISQKHPLDKTKLLKFFRNRFK